MVSLSLASILATSVLVASSFAHPKGNSSPSPSTPIVQTTNGTVQGISLPQYSQDIFLGIPFAEPPVGELRFRRPQSYNQRYHHLDATKQAATCIGYGPFTWRIDGPHSEDCLYLNVVRPQTTETDLPVLVWIYGGGMFEGGIADPRYNTSALVEKSVHMGKPVIIVSINYRVSGWGFLASKEVVEDGSTNLGLFDQRLALQWIHENIHAFGGDPDKVTISGESAGAMSTGYHTVAFDGQNDGLFRAAIMESGSALGPSLPGVHQLETYGLQGWYDAAVNSTDCQDASNTLECLRGAPFDKLNQTFAENFFWLPIIDGDFFPRLPSESYKQGRAAEIAILAGTNTDEGTLEQFTPRGTLNQDKDIRDWLGVFKPILTKKQTSDIMRLYPDDPAQGSPFNTGSKRYPKAGLQFKRGAAIAGDIQFIAGRRGTTEYYATPSNETKNPVYSYRFDQAPWNGILEDISVHEPVGVTHYTEISFVFNNTDPSYVNWIGPDPAYHRLSDVMSRSWISFVHDLNPNNHGLENVLEWPQYTSDAPKNIVFRAETNQGGSYVENDDFRKAPIAWIHRNWKNLRA